MDEKRKKSEQLEGTQASRSVQAHACPGAIIRIRVQVGSSYSMDISLSLSWIFLHWFYIYPLVL